MDSLERQQVRVFSECSRAHRLLRGKDSSSDCGCNESSGGGFPPTSGQNLVISSRTHGIEDFVAAAGVGGLVSSKVKESNLFNLLYRL